MVTADHGPAVSGAHNTIVAARAGKDLISSLASGLLTVGERCVWNGGVNKTDILCVPPFTFENCFLVLQNDTA